jgi:hypothetical protein
VKTRENRRRTQPGVPALVMILAGMVGSCACTRSVGEVPCSELQANDRYVGKRVTLYGTMTGGTFNISRDKNELVVIYTCKSKDGTAADVQVTFDENKATHTKAAGKADSGKVLQRLTGIVRGTGRPILLGKVAVALSDEADEK